MTQKIYLTKISSYISKFLVYAFLTIIASTIVFPLLWMIGTSLKEKQVLFESLSSIIPPEVYFGNYVEVLSRTMFLRSYLNSIIITVVSVVGLLIITSMAAFSFARLKWRWKEAFFALILAGQLVAPVAIIFPTFIIIDFMNLTSTYLGVIVLYLSRVAFGIFIMRSFFESIPNEIEDAAIMDGCSPYSLYWRIMLPLAKPSLAAVGIFYFFFVWNDFLYPFIVLQEQKLNTIPVSIYNLKGRYGIAWDTQTAALTMAIVPAILVTILFYKWIVKGLTAGAVK